MATYRITGKRFVMATVVDEVSLNAEGATVVTRRAGEPAVFEVGSLVTDPPPELVVIFADRFALVQELEPEPGEEPQVVDPEPKRGRR